MLMTIALLLGLLVLTAAPFFLLTPRAPEPDGVITSVTGLESYFGRLVANETPPALDITVIKDGALVYAKAFGLADGPAGTAATRDSVYHFWSVTKLFTATAIMQLVEDGTIRLEDFVTKHLPKFRTVQKSGAAAAITIGQLLDHSSGMKNLRPADLVGWIHHLNDPPASQTALLRERMQRYMTLAARPGSRVAYSNAGYIVVSAIIEAASGLSYEDFVRTRILAPLGMTSTDFVYRGDLLARAAAGSHPLFHVFTPLLLLIHRDWFSRWVSKTEKRRMWLAPLYTDYTSPTGLIGTGRDLARFGQAFLAGGELDGQRILSADTVAAMLNTGFGANAGPDGERMGRGWHWWSDAPISFKGHGGEGPGFSAQLAIFQDRKLVVVILANDTLIDRIGLTTMMASLFNSDASQRMFRRNPGLDVHL